MPKLEKTVKIKVDSKEAQGSLNTIKKGFDGINKSTKDGTTSILGMKLTVQALGLALKSAGIGIVISALVGLGNAFMNNQQIADLFNVGLEALNLGFKKLVNPMVEIIDYSATQTDLFQLQWKYVKQLAGIIKTALTGSLKGYIKMFNMVQLAWEESFLGDGDPETIERLKGNIEGINEEGKQIISTLKQQFKEGIETEKEIIKIQLENRERLAKAWNGIATDGIIPTAKALVELRNEVKLLDAEQRISQLTAQKNAEAQRQIRDDVSLSIEKRIEANNKLGTILEEQIKEELKLANKRLELAQKELANDETNIDLINAEKEALAEIVDVQERIESQQSEQKTNEVALRDERKASLQELSNIGKAELERQLNDIEIAAEKQRDLARRTIENEIELQDMLTKINKDSLNKRQDLENKAEETKLKNKLSTAKTERDIVANTLGAVSKLIGENTAAGKALAIGQALINTYSAAAAALAPPPVGAGPIFGPIAAAGAIAAGMANVKNIISTDLPGDEAGSSYNAPFVTGASTMGGIGGEVPNIDAITAPDLNAQQPVQAFVVENDISNAQALQEELEIQATL
mgnify:CR=1 FL=1